MALFWYTSTYLYNFDIYPWIFFIFEIACENAFSTLNLTFIFNS